MIGVLQVSELGIGVDESGEDCSAVSEILETEMGRKDVDVPRELSAIALPETMEAENRLEASTDPRERQNFVTSVGLLQDAVKFEPETPGLNQDVDLKNIAYRRAHTNGEASYASLGGSKKRKRLYVPDMPLRRSARRAATATLLSFPSADIVSKIEPVEISTFEENRSVDLSNLALALPPSSEDLELDGLPVLDIFSVYACLRSFSTLLFLSPFSLKAFAEALRCNFANSLVDSVHYSILQTLRSHLEGQSEEGSQSASDCLRNLNWELLDIVNWPLYLAEYLLVHHSAVSSHLKLLNGEYYEQPASVKIEVLRYLCDDVIEAELIRSELDKRMLVYNPSVDTGQNLNEIGENDNDVSDLQNSSSPNEILQEMPDGNSDECCLCKMDGSLICCDGCPAAFHSRCVGMAADLLPEGEWFCPECLVVKVDQNIKPSKSFQGAKLLGFDCHGNIYFGSCGYVLVSETSDAGSSCRYYNRNDSNSVIEFLKTSYALHAGIISSISAYWCIPMTSPVSGPPVEWRGGNKNVACLISFGMMSGLKGEMDEGEDTLEKEQHATGYQHCKSFESSKFAIATTYNTPRTRSAEASFGGSAAEQVDLKIIHTPCILDSPSSSDIDLSSKCSELMPEKNNELLTSDQLSLILEKTNDVTQVHLDISSYVNFYSFGRVTSSIAQEFTSRTSGYATTDCKMTAEDITSAQIRAIYKKSVNHYWSAIQKLPANTLKENCGWCFACKNSSKQECLLKTVENKMLVGSRNRNITLHSKDKKKSHLLSAIHYILQIEDNSHGILSGPWQNPNHKRQWRKNVLKASDVSSLKHFLLTLELHLRRVALSAEWSKPVDTNLTVGSAFYYVTSERGGRKQAKRNASETKKNADAGFSSIPNSASTSDSVVYWWRGGKLSRQIFRWRTLPHLMAFKGARQAGSRKIPGVSYPEGSEFAKRSKCVAWRAAVEMSQNVPQLVYHVKDLDTNIKWNELSYNQPLPLLVKEFRKSLRPSWKATICEKCTDGTHVRYLIDFGKRKIIPDVVIKHGVLHEESKESKKYWLDESQVPVNILKAFEARHLEQMLKKAGNQVPFSEESTCKMTKYRRQRGLSCLLSKGEKPDENICNHCDKLVLEREEAVSCQFCKGLIHKKHFRVPKGAVATTFTCYACKDKKFMDENQEKTCPEGCNEKREKRLKFDETNMNHMKKGAISVGSLKRKKLSKTVKGKSKSDGHWRKKCEEEPKDKKFANKRNGKKLLSRSTKRKLQLGKSEGIVLRKSERLAKKQQHVTKGKRRKVRWKKAKRSQPEKGKQELSKTAEEVTSWHKRRRTGICAPFWVDGLLWTRKAYDETAVHFRETRVLLPFTNPKENLQPVCSLCHSEYDSHVIYVGCENCGDWFHGDAFALSTVNINNIRGFKCHRCRAKDTPLCPYSRDTFIVVNFQKEETLGAIHLGDNSKLDCQAHDSLYDLPKQESLGANHVGDDSGLDCQLQDMLCNLPKEESSDASHSHPNFRIDCQAHESLHNDYAGAVHSHNLVDEYQMVACLPESGSGQILILESCSDRTAETTRTHQGSHVLPGTNNLSDNSILDYRAHDSLHNFQKEESSGANCQADDSLQYSPKEENSGTDCPCDTNRFGCQTHYSLHDAYSGTVLSQNLMNDAQKVVDPDFKQILILENCSDGTEVEGVDKGSDLLPSATQVGDNSRLHYQAHDSLHNFSKEESSGTNHPGDNSRLHCQVQDSPYNLPNEESSGAIPSGDNSILDCSARDSLCDNCSCGVRAQDLMDEDRRMVGIPDSGKILILENCTNRTAEIVGTDKGLHLLPEAEHSCQQYDDKDFG